MTTAHRTLLLAALVLLACEFRGNSVGKEITEMQADTEAATSSSGDDGASGNMGPMSSSASGDGASTHDEGANDEAAEESTTGDDTLPPAPTDCDLGDYFASIGENNWTCGYTPYNENLQLTHDCILSWDEGALNALWTRPVQPIAEAVHADRTVEPPIFVWYEHDAGTITTWSCSDLVETPECVVSPTDMCLTCVEPGTPTVVCAP